MFTHHEFEAVYEVLVTCYLLILDLLSNMEHYDMNQAFWCTNMEQRLTVEQSVSAQENHTKRMKI